MISLSEILHTIAQALLIPCLIILLILMAGAVWQIGDIVVEFIAERRKHKCNVPQLLRDVHTAGADGLAELIENSGLLRRQKKALLELAESRGLPKDTLTALAERLLATEEARNARTTSITDMIAKLGPMFGLLGTLIPLGPGIVALGQGDTVTLSESMNVAFDTTIAGVISAAVASVISHIRKRWYILNLADLLCQQARRQNRQNRIFRPADFYPAMQPFFCSRYHKFFHPASLASFKNHCC